MTARHAKQLFLERHLGGATHHPCSTPDPSRPVQTGLHTPMGSCPCQPDTLVSFTRTSFQASSRCGCTAKPHKAPCLEWVRPNRASHRPSDHPCSPWQRTEHARKHPQGRTLADLGWSRRSDAYRCFGPTLYGAGAPQIRSCGREYWILWVYRLAAPSFGGLDHIGWRLAHQR